MCVLNYKPGLSPEFKSAIQAKEPEIKALLQECGVDYAVFSDSPPDIREDCAAPITVNLTASRLGVVRNTVSLCVQFSRLTGFGLICYYAEILRPDFGVKE